MGKRRRAGRSRGRLRALGVTLATTFPLVQCSISGFTAAEQAMPGGVAALDAGLSEAAVAGAVQTVAAPVERAAEVVDEVALPAAASADRAGGVKPAPADVSAAASCPDPGAARALVFVSPARPIAGERLRLTAVAEEDLGAAGFEWTGLGGRLPLGESFGWGGPPWSSTVVLGSAPAGVHRWRVTAAGGGGVLACGEVEVAVAAAKRPGRAPSGIWPVERAWDGEMEALYSAWIGRLFLVDPGARAGWRPLHAAMRDARRNILWGHLGLGEDDAASRHAVVVAPDCGDTPFFLRAYFAWKMRLPFAVRHCLRGDRKRGTRCDDIPETNLTDAWDEIESPVARFNEWLEEDVGDTVHSGTGRLLPDAGPGELYAVALSRETLRPGTVFVDVGGHVLVVSQWVPGTPDRIGMLLAVDGHPDRTVSHKRFSRANFFFESDLRTGGFKAFRPVAHRRGRMRFVTDDELGTMPGYAPPSTEQFEFRSAHGFYRAVDRLLNPEPLEPARAYRAHIDAMVELLEARRTAVEIGVEYMEAHGWETIPMPQGAEIFETTGPWEDYSTPARDLRLLIALDELVGFPKTVLDNPGLFRIPEGAAPRAIERELAAAWREAAGDLGITYRRSDGSPWRLSLAEVVDRMGVFEQAYNPSDCPELRWGAPRGSEELSTCTHRTLPEQRRRMERYRWWHAERYRPSGR